MKISILKANTNYNGDVFTPEFLEEAFENWSKRDKQPTKIIQEFNSLFNYNKGEIMQNFIGKSISLSFHDVLYIIQSDKHSIVSFRSAAVDRGMEPFIRIEHSEDSIAIKKAYDEYLKQHNH